MSRYQADLVRLLAPFSSGPLLVHSDLFRTRCFVPRVRNRYDLLAAHEEVLTNAANGRCIWTPSFNYDFLRTGFVDLRKAPCQVGPFGEYRRRQNGSWRTRDPVFSICGFGPGPMEGRSNLVHTAFGDDSCFAALLRHGGAILFYGASFSSATVLHYAERLAGGPVYRYDKEFPGTVIDSSGEKEEVIYTYHVRPLGRHLDYEWSRLVTDLRAAGILCELACDGQVVARVACARNLVGFWVDAVKDDPCYLLDRRSREWVVPMHERLNRRFETSDFE